MSFADAASDTDAPSSAVDANSERDAPAVDFVPNRVVDFDGLAVGDPIASRVDFWGERGSNGFGSFASNVVTRPSKSSAAQLRIQAGTTGRAGDGSPVANGDFGFGLQIPSPDQPGEGQELWVGWWLYVPADVNYGTNTGFLKFVRITTTCNCGKIGYALAESAGTHEGYNLGCEFDPRPQEETRFVTTGYTLPPNRWVWFEVYVRASANPSLAADRIWVDDQLVIDRVGAQLRYRSGGQMNTLTVNPARSLATASDQLSGLMFFTYWNGGSPRDQSVFVQTVAYQSRIAPPFTDAEGNPFMGRAFAEGI